MPTNTIVGNDGANTLTGTAAGDLIYGWDRAGPQANVSSITATRVVSSGLTDSLFAGAPYGDVARLFIAEKGGLIKILSLETNTLLPTPFLDVHLEVNTNGEQGLLGFTFDPDFTHNGYVYINMSNSSGDTEIRRYQVSASNPNLIDPASNSLILRIDQPVDTNHKAGFIGFGPDGYLYIPTGDGGGSGDPNNNAQNINSLLGKILRIDVHSDGFPADATRNYAIPADNMFAGAGVAGADEIWALGVRNPWRGSFDRGTGAFMFGDVGQNRFEEIDIGAGGANYGWRAFEANDVFSAGTAISAGTLTPPIFSYGRAVGQTIVGGYVYRGPSEGLHGDFFYADVATDDIWTLRNVGGTWTSTTRSSQISNPPGLGNGPVSFAEDGHGALYVIALTGTVDRLTPVVTSADQGDNISGGFGDDVIFAGSGNDVVDAGEGKDSVSAGNGADLVNASYGDDVVFGDSGDDLLYGGSGDDIVNGDDGNDVISGDLGVDRLVGGAGTDLLYVDHSDVNVSGGAGADYLSVADTVGANIAATDIENWFGHTGTDVFNATGAATLIYMHGNDGNDTLTGGSSGDWLYGDANNDTINGGDGNDTLVGGLGADALNGGNGTDVLYVDAADTSYQGGAGTDYLVAQDAGPGTYTPGVSGIEYAYGFTGADIISAAGSATQSELHGGDGGDTLYGGAGVNILLGENAADSLVAGGASTDHFVGGAGADIVYEQSNGGTDYFYDYQDGSDKINLHFAGAANFAGLTIDNTYAASNWYGVNYGTGVLWVNTGGVGSLDASDFVF